MASATYDIIIDAGDDWSYSTVYERGGTPTPVDLIGPPAWSAEASFWDANGCVLRFTAGPAFTGLLAGMTSDLGALTLATGGSLVVSIKSKGSYLLTSSGRWELRIVDGAGNARRIIRGQMVVKQGPFAGLLDGGAGV